MFPFRAAQRLNLGSKPKSRKQKKKKEGDVDDSRYVFVTNFSELVMRRPPQPPSSLFKHGTVRRGDGHGKVYLHVLLYFTCFIVFYLFLFRSYS